MSGASHFMLAVSLLTACRGWARGCDAHSKVGDVCEARILRVRPTQLTVGELEVRSKAHDLAAMSGGKRKKAIKKKPLPTVIGPGPSFYIVDHHHFARALNEIGVDQAYLEIVADLSGLSPSDFQAQMERHRYVHLYDGDGRGPLNFADLPRDVAGLSDDPYRSLAWGVRQAGGYDKTNVLYADFAWADFLRARVDADLVERDFNAAVKIGLDAARGAEARGLPGYNP